MRREQQLNDMIEDNRQLSLKLDAALLQVDEMKKAAEKLGRAPTWHLRADTCDRKALEAFMERYCLWYNDVEPTEKPLRAGPIMHVPGCNVQSCDCKPVFGEKRKCDKQYAMGQDYYGFCGREQGHDGDHGRND